MRYGRETDHSGGVGPAVNGDDSPSTAAGWQWQRVDGGGTNKDGTVEQSNI